MTTSEFLSKGKAVYGDIFEDVMHYAAGMLCRGVEDNGNTVDILLELDDFSY